MEASFLFLGTGGSLGVPIIGCQCAVCTSSSPKNKRLRSSGLIKIGKKQILLDAGPDLRQMALHHGILHVDALLLTHAHADHINGLDDVRAYTFAQKKALPCLLSKETFEEVKQRFHYLLPQLDVYLLDEEAGSVNFGGVALQFFSYYQKKMKVTGYRLGTFAYVSDIKQYEPSIFKSLKGVEILVISALRHASSEMHLSVEEAIAFSKRVGAKTTYLTHITHDLEERETSALVPQGVHLSYDGLEIGIPL